ncbi:MAG: metal-dependent hydrolase [Candidatus Lokiarchaeota archaeon]|nr:metal-dependent hydrolase [Candidatus Lokiarchaeota archaeon]
MSEVFEFFLIFHVAFPLLIFELPLIKRKFKFNRVALIVGSLLPDIIDKPLLFMNLGSGRGISHTILFILISFMILHLIVKKKTDISVLFLLGMVFHLILDLPEVPLFFPFISYEFILIEVPLELWLYTLFNDPTVYLTEIAGFLILIFILINNRLFNRKDIVNFLKRNTDSVTRQNTTEPFKN